MKPQVEVWSVTEMKYKIYITKQTAKVWQVSEQLYNDDTMRTITMKRVYETPTYEDAVNLTYNLLVEMAKLHVTAIQQKVEGFLQAADNNKDSL